jgi:hypothetical protein
VQYDGVWAVGGRASLVKIDRMWASTVRGLRNSQSPTVVLPNRARALGRRFICSSDEQTIWLREHARKADAAGTSWAAAASTASSSGAPVSEGRISYSSEVAAGTARA